MTPIVFLYSADVDIQAAYEFYEDRWGRGDALFESLDRSFALLRDFPEIAPAFFGKYRRMLVRSFPYGIFYTLEQRGIIVAAVLDLRQDPEAITRRLRR